MNDRVKQKMQTNPDPLGWPIPTGFFECTTCGALCGGQANADLHNQWHEGLGK